MKEQNEQHRLEEINRPMNSAFFNNLEKQYQELAKVKAESEQIEKQAIEEMAKTIGRARGYGCRDKDSCESCLTGRVGCMAYEVTQILYQEDYRKQSEGKWIEHGEIGAMNTDWECSVCHWKTVSFTEMKHSNFCPNCGAKMKGDKNEQREAD